MAPACTTSATSGLTDGTDVSLYALVETIDGTAFLPPLGPEPGATTGTFDAGLLARLQVVLEATDAGGATRTLATFDAASTPHLVLLAPHELYWMNVPAAAYFTDPALAYRFRALLDGREIGRSDMSSRVFDVMRYVPTLPVGVKLRVERRAAPAIAALAPSRTVRGSADLTLTVTGSGFASDSVVSFAGHDLATTKISTTELTAIVPAALLAASAADEVVVFTPAPGGGTSAAATFAVFDPTPAIAALTPATAIADGASLALTLDGTWFDATSIVRLDGAALATTLAGARLVATVPGTSLEAAADHAVVVDNGGALVSAPATFSVTSPLPTLASITPAELAMGSASITLTLSGGGFTRQSAVALDGAPMATTFVSTSALRATIPAASLATSGVKRVTVTSPAPGGGTSASVNLTVDAPVPTLTALTPASATAGGAGFTLTVDGGAFLSGATVSFAGTSLATTFVSSTRLTATLPAAMISAAGSDLVTVRNPAPTTGASAALTFVVHVPNYFGSGADGVFSTTGNVNLGDGVADGDMVVRNYTNLTINAGHTVTTAARKKGLLIYVQGDAVIDGTLTMTARGAALDPVAAGVSASGLQLIRRTAGGTQGGASNLAGCGAAAIAAEAGSAISGGGTVFTIARGGAAGGASVGGYGVTAGGLRGGSGTAGQSGGGGSGAANWGISGGGAAGTCFSGGAGGGGSRGEHTSTPTAGAGQANGGAGGNGASGWYESGGGGAGNPGGAAGQGYSGATGQAGGTGTGGLLILVVRGNLTIGSTGQITANGVAGGSSNIFAGVGGGGSGGGNILILYGGALSNSGVIQANGGAAGTTPPGGAPGAGAGGNGSIQGPTQILL